MSGGQTQRKPKYTVRYEDGAWTGLTSLPEPSQDKIFKLARDHLSHTPTQRIAGKLKRLKGEYSDYYQYDITQGIRLIFRVDEANKTVNIDYIGPHPDWKRSRSRAF